MFERWKEKFGNTKEQVKDNSQLTLDNIPRHVAIIMDGNGRWAKEKGLPRIAGHRMGMKTIKRITTAANEVGVEVLTLYAFSTENWKRPKDEVDFLMRLPQEFLAIELDELIKQNVRVRMMGWREELPDFTLKAVEEAEEKTRNNTGLVLNFALNYGSRRELLEGFRHMAQDLNNGLLSLDQITESEYQKYLHSASLPDPDLMIRTSGELRISNFMLWQLAYAELWFTDVYWPAFTDEHFYQAIIDYQNRVRRYGGL